MPTLDAHITKVEHDMGTGWFRISTDGDPKRLDTKIREKAEEAAKLKESGVLAHIEFSENPRTVDGKTYRNARYERATEAQPELPGVTGSGIESIPPTASGSDTYQRRKHPEERWQIALQGGMHAAIATIPHLPPEQRGFESQKRVALAWADFLMTQEMPAYDDPGRDSGIPPHSDDDIPF